MLWLSGGFSAVALCFWYPLWLDSQIPEEHDSRIWMIMPSFIPFVLSASVMAVISYALLWRAVLQRLSKRSVAALAFGSLMLATAAPPGIKIIWVYINIWKLHHA